jgi:hypothetical protein
MQQKQAQIGVWVCSPCARVLLRHTATAAAAGTLCIGQGYLCSQRLRSRLAAAQPCLHITQGQQSSAITILCCTVPHPPSKQKLTSNAHRPTCVWLLLLLLLLLLVVVLVFMQASATCSRRAR